MRMFTTNLKLTIDDDDDPVCLISFHLLEVI